ncbi:MAG TPA: hydrogenase maturation protease [Methylococcaceae bacterium]|nr:hydrogenase maturation protease [Methylococcaceae bacterium]
MALSTDPAPLLIIAVGNESRGDDALGPLLLREISALAEADGVELLEDYQLQIEHALDMAGRKQVLFVDAGHHTPAPFVFQRVQPARSPSPSTHALTPGALLSVYEQVERHAPPPAFVLCIRGERFELGESLTPAAERHLEQSVEFARGLLSDARPERWESLIRP